MSIIKPSSKRNKLAEKNAVKYDQKDCGKNSRTCPTVKINNHTNIMKLLDNMDNLNIDCSNKPISKLKLDSSTSAQILGTNQFHKLIETIGSKYPKSKRLGSLKMLLDSHFFDSMNIEDWKNVQKHFRDNLTVKDTDIFDITLEIFKRLLYSTLWDIVNETFIILVETLYLNFHNIGVEINIEKYPYKNVFKIYKLILFIFNNLVLNSSRIGPNKLEQMIGSFVDLLAMHEYCTGGENLTPTNIVSLLDIRGRWFFLLSYNATCRLLLFNSIQRNINIIQNMTNYVYEWLSDPITLNTLRGRVIKMTGTKFIILKGRDEVNIEINSTQTLIMLKYVLFNNTIYILNHLCKYRIFHNLLLPPDENTTTTKSLMTQIFEFLSSQSKSLPIITMEILTELGVNLLKIQKIDLIPSYFYQCITKPVVSKNYSLYIIMAVKKIVQDESLMYNLLKNCVEHKENSISNWKPPTGLMKYDENMFTFVVTVLYATLDNVEHFEYILEICTLISQFSYLLVSNQNHILNDIIWKIRTEYERLEENKKISHKTRFRNFILSVAKSPFGFKNLCLIPNVLKEFLEMTMHDNNLHWNCPEWRIIVSMANLVPEYRDVFRDNFDLVFCQLLTYLQRICNGDIISAEMSLILNKIIQIICTFAVNFEGVSLLFCGFQTNGSITAHVDEKSIPTFNIIEWFETGFSLCHKPNFQYTMLRILDLLTLNFSSVVYLNYHLNYQEKLNTSQKPEEVANDECNTIQYLLLLRSYCPEMLHNRITTSHLPLLSQVHYHTVPKITSRYKQKTNIENFLECTKHGLCYNRLKQAREIYKASLTQRIKENVILDLIEKVGKSLTKPVRICKMITTRKAHYQELFPEDHTGIIMAVRYGMRQGLLSESRTSEQSLAELIRIIRHHVDVNLLSFSNWDCFLSTIFIMASGSLERCFQVISCIMTLPITIYIWSHGAISCDNEQWHFGYVLEWLLENEVPTVFHALKTIGISWWVICRTQINDCFWMSMDWINVCHWIAITILHSPDYMLYFFTSVAYTNEENILRASYDETLWKVTLTLFHSCKLADHIAYMDNLDNKYHRFVSTAFS